MFELARLQVGDDVIIECHDLGDLSLRVIQDGPFPVCSFFDTGADRLQFRSICLLGMVVNGRNIQTETGWEFFRSSVIDADFALHLMYAELIDGVSDVQTAMGLHRVRVKRAGQIIHEEEAS